MKAYRLSVNLKLALILFAVLIAVASLAYTNHLVDRLRAREGASVRIWARANEQLVRAPSFNPFQGELADLDRMLGRLERLRGPGAVPLPDPDALAAYRRAVAWAQTMPPDDQVNFITDEIVIPNHFGVPAIITDSTSQRPIIWRNAVVPDSASSPADTLRLRRQVEDMAALYPPIPIELAFPEGTLKQYVYFGESDLIKELRIYPYIQLLFVGLFVLIGYLGFSYVRRSEQSSLWVGMAREAAHQLGTPISSLMGWLELLRQPNVSADEQTVALDEVEKDIERLSRVTSRFSDIGSMPRLERQPLAPVVGRTADYIRRRLPSQGKRVRLDVDVPDELSAPLNAELFEWVVENLLKNALDAIEKEEGHIAVVAHRHNGHIVIDVQDNGKGIDRRQWKNVFRPGYSTKKRGWGLGLSLAKRIIEDYHGGGLTLLQSKVGHGSTFRIDLPAMGGREATGHDGNTMRS